MELLPPSAEAREFQESVPVNNEWVLLELKPMHKQVAALLAQGFKNVQVAAMTNITPEYVSMLLRQPLIRQEIARLCDIANTRMESLFESSVDAVAEVLVSGSHKDKLAAARLQMEATRRIGRFEAGGRDTGDNIDRLEKLADRLLQLQSNVRKGNTYENGEAV